MPEISPSRSLWQKTSLNSGKASARSMKQWMCSKSSRSRSCVTESRTVFEALMKTPKNWNAQVSETLTFQPNTIKRHGFLMQFFESWSVAYNNFWSYSGKLTNFNLVQRKSWRNSTRELHLHRIHNTTFWAAAILLWRSLPWPGKLQSLTVSQDWLLRHGVWANLKQSS